MTAGGGQMGGDDMEHRVGTLEKSFARMEGKLDRLLDESREFREGAMVRFARIEETLDTRASAVELAEVKGRVNVPPSIF